MIIIYFYIASVSDKICSPTLEDESMIINHNDVETSVFLVFS